MRTEAMRTKATTLNVLIADLTELLSAANPDNAAAIQHVINTTTPDELEARLAEGPRRHRGARSEPRADAGGD